MRLRHFYILSLALAAVVLMTARVGYCDRSADHSASGFSLSEGMTSADERDDDTVGEVTAIDAAKQQFTLRTRGSSEVLVVTTDGNTEFDDFDKAGLANAFSSIAVGQVLDVELVLSKDRRLKAKEVELVSTKKTGN